MLDDVLNNAFLTIETGEVDQVVQLQLHVTEEKGRFKVVAKVSQILFFWVDNCTLFWKNWQTCPSSSWRPPPCHTWSRPSQTRALSFSSKLRHCLSTAPGACDDCSEYFNSKLWSREQGRRKSKCKYEYDWWFVLRQNLIKQIALPCRVPVHHPVHLHLVHDAHLHSAVYSRDGPCCCHIWKIAFFRQSWDTRSWNHQVAALRAFSTLFENLTAKLESLPLINYVLTDHKKFKEWSRPNS